MTDRPVLLGMNNPQSADPEAAFFPRPVGCAGHRLLQMLRLHQPEASEYDFIRAFDRRNILDMLVWVPEFAEVVAPDVWRRLDGRTVVVFGQEPRRVLGLPEVDHLLWQESDGVRWCLAPHPSGKSRYYNDPLYRHAVGLRLESLYAQTRAGVR